LWCCYKGIIYWTDTFGAVTTSETRKTVAHVVEVTETIEGTGVGACGVGGVEEARKEEYVAKHLTVM